MSIFLEMTISNRKADARFQDLDSTYPMCSIDDSWILVVRSQIDAFELSPLIKRGKFKHRFCCTIDKLSCNDLAFEVHMNAIKSEYVYLRKQNIGGTITNICIFVNRLSAQVLQFIPLSRFAYWCLSLPFVQLVLNLLIHPNDNNTCCSKLMECTTVNREAKWNFSCTSLRFSGITLRLSKAFCYLFRYISHFKKTKDELVERLFGLYNQTVFEHKVKNGNILNLSAVNLLFIGNYLVIFIYIHNNITQYLQKG